MLARPTIQRLAAITAIVASCILTLPTVAFASSAPKVGAESAEVGETAATLSASIRPDGLATEYAIWLRYTTCEGGNSCEVTERVGSGSIPASSLERVVTANLTGLQPNHTYTSAIVANNADGTSQSLSVTFTTLPAAPSGEGGSGAGEPYNSKNESWVSAGAANSASEAPRREEERQAKRREEEERPAKEAAARAAKEREIREAIERELASASKQATQCLVPHLTGDSLKAARHALHHAHCKLGAVSKPRRDRQHLVVVSQSVPRGRELHSQAAISVRLGASSPAKKRR